MRRRRRQSIHRCEGEKEEWSGLSGSSEEWSGAVAIQLVPRRRRHSRDGLSAAAAASPSVLPSVRPSFRRQQQDVIQFRFLRLRPFPPLSLSPPATADFVRKINGSACVCLSVCLSVCLMAARRGRKELTHFLAVYSNRL